MRIKPATRPETYSKLVARSLTLYKAVLPQTFIFALLISIILFIPRLICVAVGQNVFLTTIKVNQVALLYLAMYISTLWFLAALLWCINCLERNQHKNFVVDIEMAGKRVLQVFVTAIVLLFVISLVGFVSYSVHKIFWLLKLYSYNEYFTAILLLIVCLIQVGITVLLSTLFYFYFPLIVIEHDSIIKSLKQSAQLVWGRIWETVRLQVTPWLVYFLVLLLVKMVFKINIHIYFMPLDSVSSFFPTLVHIAILAFFIPWGSSMVLVQLRDLELRKASTRRKK